MNPSLKWLVLDDFTPGIIQRLGQSRSGYGPAPLGAAAASGTYRCYALPGGGLAPLPRRTFSMIPPDTAAVFNGATQVFNSGFKAHPKFSWGPAFGTTAPEFAIRDIRNTSDPTFNVNFYMGHEYTTAATPTEQRIAIVRHDFTGGAWTHRLLQSITGANAQVTGRTSPVYFVQTALTEPGGAGVPETVVVWMVVKAQRTTAPSTDAQTRSAMEPGPLNTGTSIQTLDFVGIPIAHQGRVVSIRRVVSYVNSTDKRYIQSDNWMDWTSVGTADQETLGSLINYFPETPFGSGAWASVSASDLFIVKHFGGGVLIQGDLNNPMVRRLPAVPSTNGSECVGVMTQLGFIYGVNRGGVYAWQGGDGAELLSGQLDQDFWLPADTTTFQNFQGQFSTIGDLILCPNNWVYSITTKSWWRIEDTASLIFHMFDVDPTSAYLYATPVSFNPGDTPAVYGFRQDQGASSYRWTSQPILTTDSRQASIDEIVLTAQGNGTVTITIDGQAVAFDIASATSPVRIRKTLGRSVDVLTLQVDSTETTGGVVGAPIIYEIRLGLKEERGLPTAA